MKDTRGNVVIGPWPGSGVSPLKLYVIVDSTGNLVGGRSYRTAGHAKTAVKTRYDGCGYYIAGIPAFATVEWTLAPDGTWLQPEVTP